MLLFFVIVIFFMIHVQFLLRNLLFGVSESTYFEFISYYPFGFWVAFESLLFTTICALMFAIGYKMSASLVFGCSKTDNQPNFSLSRYEVLLLNIFCFVSVFYMGTLEFITGFDYGEMVVVRESSTFILELRIVFLLLLSHIALNLGLKNFFQSSRLYITRILLYSYFIVAILFQARSLLFELIAIFAFVYIVWNNDKIKTRYLIGLLLCLFLANVIVLGRLGMPSDIFDFFDGIFSFEYSVIFNNLLSAAIENHDFQLDGYTFSPSISLLVPSPIRDMLAVSVDKSEYYQILSELAEVRGGGFSLLAEMYSNFGWLAPAVFSIFGSLIGYFNSRSTLHGRVSITDSVAPLLYAAFIMSFRNDFGVFLKYSIQLLLISWVLKCILPQRN